MGVLDAEYQRMYDLKKYVLEPSLKQINEHTDITASYEQHKKRADNHRILIQV